MNFFSDDRQDEFVYNLLKFKRNGYYLDIGSCASIGSNNTYFFEHLDWEGICIEKNSNFNEGYETRTCKYYNVDALEVDYEKLFKENGFPHGIDFLSLDIDNDSTKVLKILPLDIYRFKVITIEHDAHIYGDYYKVPQRKILKKHGYFLVGDEVLNQSGRNINKEHGWEDWYAHPGFFEKEYLEKLYSYRLYTSEIIDKIKFL